MILMNSFNLTMILLVTLVNRNMRLIIRTIKMTSFQKNNENTLSVDFEVDDILHSLDTNTNYNNNCDMSDECSQKIISSIDTVLERDSDISLKEFDSNSNYPNGVSTLVLPIGISLDTKSAHSVTELSRLNSVQSKLNVSVIVPKVELLHCDESYLEKSDLVNGVQSILAIFRVSPE